MLDSDALVPFQGQAKDSYHCPSLPPNEVLLQCFSPRLNTVLGGQQGTSARNSHGVRKAVSRGAWAHGRLFCDFQKQFVCASSLSEARREWQLWLRLEQAVGGNLEQLKPSAGVSMQTEPV